MTKIVEIQVIIDTESMVDFFKNDSSWGSANKPYLANNFCNVKACGATSTGIFNVFELEPGQKYQFRILNYIDPYSSKRTQQYTIVENKMTYNISMIREGIPTRADWEKMFDLSSEKIIIGLNGDLIIVSDQMGDFFISTQNVGVMEKKYNLQYTIKFQLRGAKDGDIKLGIIDPLIANTTRIFP